jgi:CubicO group peptidase (beta-lactamase class C family)
VSLGLLANSENPRRPAVTRFKIDHVDQGHFELLIDDLLHGVSAAGIAVSVSMGDVTASRCHGQVGDSELKPTTVIYAASVTKQMVAFMTAIAVEDRRLDYDGRIVDVMPRLPLWLREVRIRHLLHHTSDIPEITESIGPARDNDLVIDRLRERAFDVTPGVQFAYSNTGYVLLAEILARAYATPIDQLGEQLLFRPLGMTASRLGGRHVSLADFPDPPGTVGDGGLWTTLDDLSAWLIAVNQRRPHAAAAKRVGKPGALDDGLSLEYGLGVRVKHTQAGELLTHGGTWPGWLAKTVRYPGHALSVAVLSQSDDEDAISRLGTSLGERMAAAVGTRLGHPPPTWPRLHRPQIL